MLVSKCKIRVKLRAAQRDTRDLAQAKNGLDIYGRRLESIRDPQIAARTCCKHSSSDRVLETAKGTFAFMFGACKCNIL